MESNLQLTKITISHKKLSEVRSEWRSFFLYAGHISNELNWLNRNLLILQIHGANEKNKEKPSESDGVHFSATTVQTLIVLRLLSGKIVEAVNFLRKHCCSKEWFKELEAIASAEAKKAIAKYGEYELRFYPIDGRASDLDNLRKMRDKISFHYDEKAFKNSGRLDLIVDPFTLHLESRVGNCFYDGSESTLMNSYLNLAFDCGAEEAIDKWIKDVLDISASLGDMFGHSLAIIADYLTESKGDYQIDEILIKGSRPEDISLVNFLDIDR